MLCTLLLLQKRMQQRECTMDQVGMEKRMKQLAENSAQVCSGDEQGNQPQITEAGLLALSDGHASSKNSSQRRPGL